MNEKMFLVDEVCMSFSIWLNKENLFDVNDLNSGEINMMMKKMLEDIISQIYKDRENQHERRRP